jgi:hypothetical protein
MLHLTDIDELVQKIKNSYVKEYMIEALNAYRAGAYRASIAIIWTAVCIDIVEKIKDLNLQGDKMANKHAKHLEDITRLDIDPKESLYKQQDFEKDLIRIAREDFEFIPHYEATQLERLKQDRNFCIHPTFQNYGRHIKITPESVRNHIINTCNSLFIFPATKGGSLLKELEELVLGSTFSEDSKEAELLLFVDQRLGRAREAVKENFLIILLKNLFGSNAPDEPERKKVSKICAAINAIYRKEYSVANKVCEEKLTQLLTSLDDSKIKILFLVMRDLDFINKYITESKTDKRLIKIIEGFESAEIIKLEVALLADKNSNIKSALTRRIGELEEIDKKAHHQWLEDFKSIRPKHIEHILKNSPSSSTKGYAIKLFINSRTFDETEDFGKFVLLPHAKFFDKSDLKKIFEGILSNNPGTFGALNQIIGAAYVTADILKNLYTALTFFEDTEWESFALKLVQIGGRDANFIAEQIREKINEIPF